MVWLSQDSLTLLLECSVTYIFQSLLDLIDHKLICFANENDVTCYQLEDVGFIKKVEKFKYLPMELLITFMWNLNFYIFYLNLCFMLIARNYRTEFFVYKWIHKCITNLRLQPGSWNEVQKYNAIFKLFCSTMSLIISLLVLIEVGLYYEYGLFEESEKQSIRDSGAAHSKCSFKLNEFWKNLFCFMAYLNIKHNFIAFTSAITSCWFMYDCYMLLVLPFKICFYCQQTRMRNEPFQQSLSHFHLQCFPPEIQVYQVNEIHVRADRDITTRSTRSSGISTVQEINLVRETNNSNSSNNEDLPKIQMGKRIDLYNRTSKINLYQDLESITIDVEERSHGNQLGEGTNITNRNQDLPNTTRLSEYSMKADSCETQLDVKNELFYLTQRTDSSIYVQSNAIILESYSPTIKLDKVHYQCAIGQEDYLGKTHVNNYVTSDHGQETESARKRYAQYIDRQTFYGSLMRNDDAGDDLVGCLYVYYPSPVTYRLCTRFPELDFIPEEAEHGSFSTQTDQQLDKNDNKSKVKEVDYSQSKHLGDCPDRTPLNTDFLSEYNSRTESPSKRQIIDIDREPYCQGVLNIDYATSNRAKFEYARYPCQYAYGPYLKFPNIDDPLDELEDCSHPTSICQILDVLLSQLMSGQSVYEDDILDWTTDNRQVTDIDGESFDMGTMNIQHSAATNFAKHVYVKYPPPNKYRLCVRFPRCDIIPEELEKRSFSTATCQTDDTYFDELLPNYGDNGTFTFQESISARTLFDLYVQTYYGWITDSKSTGQVMDIDEIESLDNTDSEDILGVGMVYKRYEYQEGSLRGKNVDADLHSYPDSGAQSTSKVHVTGESYDCDEINMDDYVAIDSNTVGQALVMLGVEPTDSTDSVDSSISTTMNQSVYKNFSNLKLDNADVCSEYQGTILDWTPTDIRLPSYHNSVSESNSKPHVTDIHGKLFDRSKINIQEYVATDSNSKGQVTKVLGKPLTTAGMYNDVDEADQIVVRHLNYPPDYEHRFYLKFSEMDLIKEEFQDILLSTSSCQSQNPYINKIQLNDEDNWESENHGGISDIDSDVYSDHGSEINSNNMGQELDMLGVEPVDTTISEDSTLFIKSNESFYKNFSNLKLDELDMCTKYQEAILDRTPSNICLRSYHGLGTESTSSRHVDVHGQPFDDGETNIKHYEASDSKNMERVAKAFGKPFTSAEMYIDFLAADQITLRHLNYASDYEYRFCHKFFKRDVIKEELQNTIRCTSSCQSQNPYLHKLLLNDEDNWESENQGGNSNELNVDSNIYSDHESETNSNSMGQELDKLEVEPVNSTDSKGSSLSTTSNQSFNKYFSNLELVDIEVDICVEYQSNSLDCTPSETGLYSYYDWRTESTSKKHVTGIYFESFEKTNTNIKHSVATYFAKRVHVKYPSLYKYRLCVRFPRCGIIPEELENSSLSTTSYQTENTYYSKLHLNHDEHWNYKNNGDSSDGPPFDSVYDLEADSNSMRQFTIVFGKSFDSIKMHNNFAATDRITMLYFYYPSAYEYRLCRRFSKMDVILEELEGNSLSTSRNHSFDENFSEFEDNSLVTPS